MTAITIGMPVFNGERYLDKALSTICAQSFTDIRIFVSDNASTDATPEIIRKWATRDARVVAHRQPSNIGAFANFEWVMNQANTEFFMFAAHDDEWSNSYVASLHAAIKSRTGLRLAVPQVVYTDLEGEEYDRWPYPERLEYLSGVSKVKGLFKLARGSWFYGLYRREYLLEAWNASKDFGFAWSQDFLILLPFFLSCEVTGNNDAEILVRVTDASAQNYRPKRYLEQKKLFFSFLRVAIKAIQDAPLSPLQKAIIYPAIWQYTNRRGFKLSRVIRSAIKERLHLQDCG